MRRFATLALVALTALLAPAATLGKPSESQTLFRRMLLDDERVTAGVKRLLRSNAGIIDPRSGFVDVTGDNRSDALVFVTTNGAAGSVALYVFSTHGTEVNEEGESPPLRLVYRNQSLYRATLRLRETTITIVQPRFSPGDDLCCPQKMIERDYLWSNERTTFARLGATREVDGPGAPRPPEPQQDGTGTDTG